jgi:DNA-directed RNA polymerase subunit RPC12/RpoP
MNEDEILCPLCGYQYLQKDGVSACGACPLSTGCEQVCCPHCGYRVFTSSRIVTAFRRLFGLDKEVAS